MFMYDLSENGNIGIIDYFYMMTVREFCEKFSPTVDNFLDEDFIGCFVVDAFLFAARCDSCWEYEFREAYLTGIPVLSGTTTNALMLVFKQQNNGSTFVVSQIELPHLGESLPVVLGEEDVNLELVKKLTDHALHSDEQSPAYRNEKAA